MACESVRHDGRETLCEDAEVLVGSVEGLFARDDGHGVAGVEQFVLGSLQEGEEFLSEGGLIVSLKEAAFVVEGVGFGHGGGSKVTRAGLRLTAARHPARATHPAYVKCAPGCCTSQAKSGRRRRHERPRA